MAGKNTRTAGVKTQPSPEVSHRVLALLLLLSALPFAAAALVPHLSDYQFWGLTPLKYSRPWGPLLYALTAVFCATMMWRGNDGAARAWEAVDRALFVSPRRKWLLVLLSLLAVALTSAVRIYDVAGDGIVTMKWVIHPFMQGEWRGIPNSLVFQCLLQPWLEDYDRLAEAWRWLARLSVALYVPLCYLVARLMLQGRTHCFALMLTSGVTLYNYFGHLDYYCLQILYFLATLAVVLAVLRERWPVWSLLPAWLIGATLYLPIGIELLVPCAYVIAYRWRERIPLRVLRTVTLTALVIIGVLGLPYCLTHGYLAPGAGTENSVLSLNRLAMVLNHFYYSAPLAVLLCGIAIPAAWRLVRNLWSRPFEQPLLAVVLLLAAPGFGLNTVMDLYHGWFDMDNMAIYHALPLMLLLGLCLANVEQSRPATTSPGVSWLSAGAIGLNLIFSALMIGFFANRQCLEVFMRYVNRYTDMRSAYSFNHTGNRVPVLLSLGEYELAAAWMEERDTRRFPISLLNWQDVIMDHARKAARTQPPQPPPEFESLRRNPWFWLVQLQPAFYFSNQSPAWMNQRAALYGMLLQGEAQLPAAARATLHAFGCMDERLIGMPFTSLPGAKGPPTIGLAQALADYFITNSVSRVMTNGLAVDLRQDVKTSSLSLDVRGQLETATSITQPFHYQFLYFHTGANHVTASNLTKSLAPANVPK
ncbi:MAG: hypothetical protein HZC54_03385 [Verrucomicrobia bacterium]|nr:hypothetical protein [Verrucomicrobiota bacterium]